MLDVYLESNFVDYYDEYLKSPLPLYVFNREYSIIKDQSINFTPVSRIVTKTCFIEIDNQWRLVNTNNAKLLYGNKRAFPNENYTFMGKQVYIGNKCYSISNSTCTISQAECRKHIIEVDTVIGNTSIVKVLKREINSSLYNIGLNQFISANDIAKEISNTIKNYIKGEAI